MYTIQGFAFLPLTTKCTCEFNTLTAAKCELSTSRGRQRGLGFCTIRSLVQVSVSTIAGVSQTTVAGVSQSTVSVVAIAAVVGRGGVQGRSGMDQRCGVDQGSGVHDGNGLGGHLVGVGIRSGHRVGHNGGGVALDDRGVRDHGRSVGRSQGGAVSQSVAMAVGRDHSGIGHGAQGRDEGDLGSTKSFRMIPETFGILVVNPYSLTSLNILLALLWVALTS